MLIRKIEKCVYLGIANFKMTTLYNLLFSIVFLCLVPVVQTMYNLDSISTAICLEKYVSIIGIIMLVPVFLPEESKGINESLYSKSTSQSGIQVMRIILSIISIFVLVTLFSMVLKRGNCVFPMFKYIYGTTITAVFLGSIGMFFSNLFNRTIMGYIASFGYLVLNLFTANKYVGEFFIMSMSRNSFVEKYWLLFGSIVLIGLTLLIREMKNRLNYKLVL